MQQLSLFDFGGEQPKDNTKKHPAKKEKAKPAASDDLFAEQQATVEKTDTITEGKPDTAEFSTEFIVEELEETIVPESLPETENDERNDEVIMQPAEKTIAQKRGRKSFKEIDKEVDLIEVPPDEELFQKQYYPISVVAKWFRVNTSLLRFWENQFKILKPKKNKKGDRFFRPEDVKNLKLIYHLLRQKKLTIDGANKHLKAHKEHTEENLQLIHSLNKFKSFLLELKANVE